MNAQGIAGIAAVHAADVDAKARFPHEAIDAMREARLLSALVPSAFGGGDVRMAELASICEVLGQQCASTAMIFAMHQIQVACIVRHAGPSAFFRDYMRELAREQPLIASVTSEVGVGGEIRRSVAAIDRQGDRFRLEKDATTISYGAEADDLLVTARRAMDAAPNDQVLALISKRDYVLERKTGWDTLGMRGTCSPGFQVVGSGSLERVLPCSFAEIADQTMVPFSHILWSSCWLGIATGAVARARMFVRQQARAKPGTTPPTALRLAEAVAMLQTMRANVHDVATECETLMQGDTAALSSIAFALKMNNLKVASSQLVLQIALAALSICGIAGYKNDTPFALGRHLRDACSASLMVGNDRIFATNASMLLVLKDD
jgi:acyl-CoA dehydrogenase